jgi:hypothetical protein
LEGKIKSNEESESSASFMVDSGGKKKECIITLRAKLVATLHLPMATMLFINSLRFKSQ